MKRIISVTITALLLASVIANTIGATNYTDLRPTYTQVDEYTLYVDRNLNTDDSLRRRANCYGYAMRLHYGKDDIDTWAYSQLPGEFYDKSGSSMTYDDLYAYYESDYNNDGKVFDWQTVYRFITYDAAQLGYSVTSVGSYNPNVQFTPPAASTNSNKRLIALVEKNDGSDCHFYMQHDDNSWSHKPAANNATPNCIECGIALTNLNLSTHIHHYTDGTFEDTSVYDGKVFLFWIDANGSPDRFHEEDQYDDPYCTRVSPKEIPGDYLCSAMHIEDITNETLINRINYIDDIDCFIFDVATTGDYNFTFQKDTYAYRIYIGEVANGFAMSNTTVKSLYATTSSVSFTKNLQTGKRYFIKVIAHNQTSYDSSMFYYIDSYLITN